MSTTIADYKKERLDHLYIALDSERKTMQRLENSLRIARRASLPTTALEGAVRTQAQIVERLQRRIREAQL